MGYSFLEPQALTYARARELATAVFANVILSSPTTRSLHRATPVPSASATTPNALAPTGRCAEGRTGVCVAAECVTASLASRGRLVGASPTRSNVAHPMVSFAVGRATVFVGNVSATLTTTASSAKTMWLDCS